MGSMEFLNNFVLFNFSEHCLLLVCVYISFHSRFLSLNAGIKKYRYDSLQPSPASAPVPELVSKSYGIANMPRRIVILDCNFRYQYGTGTVQYHVLYQYRYEAGWN